MKTVLIVSFICCIQINAFAQKSIKLFNGKNLEGWYSFLEYKGKNNDPENIITVENKKLKISGKERGYLVTHKSFTNFHLIAEFKWGKQKYPPRENDKRDNGILYFVGDSTQDKVWPKCIEYQIQEGDCGDFWLIDSTTVKVNNEWTLPDNYVRVVKQKDAENKSGKWNRIEIVVKNNEVKHIINGVLVNAASYPNITSGRIAVQSEYAEIIYRKIELIEL